MRDGPTEEAGVLKARSVFVGFLRCEPGHHRDFVHWHDTDHRPENVGLIEHVYHAERWIAPPTLVDSRVVDASGLVPDPGQYLHTYWSTAPPDQLLRDMTTVRERLDEQGRCEPINRDFAAMWRDRMHPVAALVPSDRPLSADAVPLAPNDGVVVTLLELPAIGEDGSSASDYAHHVLPAVVALPGVLGLYTFVPMNESDHHLVVHLCYVEGDPLLVQHAIGEVEADLGAVRGRVHVRGSYLASTAPCPSPYE